MTYPQAVNLRTRGGGEIQYLLLVQFIGENTLMPKENLDLHHVHIRGIFIHLRFGIYKENIRSQVKFMSYFLFWNVSQLKIFLLPFNKPVFYLCLANELHFKSMSIFSILIFQSHVHISLRTFNCHEIESQGSHTKLI